MKNKLILSHLLAVFHRFYKLYLIVYMIFVCSTAYGSYFTQEITQLLQTHPSLSSQQYLIEAADDGITKAKSGFLPSIDIFSSIEKEKTNRSIIGSQKTYDSKTAELTITQNLFSGYSDENKTSIAELESKIQWVIFDKVKQDLLLSAIKSYINILKQTKLLEIAENNESILASQLALEEERFKHGAAIEADVLQSKVRQQFTKERKVLYFEELELAIAKYIEIFSHAPELEKMQNIKIPEQKIPQTLYDALAQTTKSNPELNQFRLETEKTKLQIFIEKSAYYPSINLVGKSEWSDGDEGFDRSKKDASIGIQLQWNLFNGKRNNANLNIARKNHASIIEDYIIAENKYKELTHSNWKEYNISKKRVVILKNAADMSRLLFEQRKELRAAGENTAKNVLDARSEYFNSQTRHTSTKYNNQIKAVELLYACGLLTPELIISELKSKTIEQKKSKYFQQESPRLSSFPPLTDRDWLLQQSPENFVIQLISVRNKNSIDGLIDKTNVSDRFAVYTIKNKGNDIYVMVYGSFSDKKSAKEAIKSLPINHNKYHPWVREVSMIQHEINRGYK
ncbi:MAG: TolC family protein [gamma proteobacterium symbiont of Taylorina sp.]|nr:TolC family protein [gamma proteobacterium symbiont of Taylorina sp.]